MADWDDRLDFSGIVARLERAAQDAVVQSTEHVLTESRKVAPIEEGTLERSGRTSVEAQSGQVVGAISYDTPYAVVQHEAMDFRHDEGRQAKYLEGPLTGESDVVRQIVANAMRRAMG